MGGALNVYAGAEALQHIRNQGLVADDIAMVLGASSGPKWLVLHGIDQYLLGDFFHARQKPLHLLGTSAGAWRMACYAQQDALAAHNRLTEAYLGQRYAKRPTMSEIQATCRDMVEQFIGPQGAQEILDHPYARMHLITTQCHGATRVPHRYSQALVYLITALLNALHRKTLNLQFTRVVVHHPQSKPPLKTTPDIRTRHHPLTAEKLLDSVLSTGCIPVIIEGVKDVAGPGIFQDGGITDYGFDLPFLPDDGFVLYPHFAQRPVPGWFDKSLSWRKPKHTHYSKTILVVPSPEFIAHLPYGKIPDRKDFSNMDDNTRIKYWKTVIAETQRFGDELATLNWQERVRPLPW
ncbi:MAG: patatin-like phospholipase family protein [Pseudomonadales bacterium]|nr:patatin-like phospholipase family protein [Pseudomonadales bacterium]